MCINNTLLIIACFGVVLSTTACNRTPVVNPVPPVEPSYFMGFSFQPKPVSSSQTLVKAALCTAQEPTDLEINIYTFRPDTNADEALDQVLHPGSVPITPTAVVSIRTKYTDPAGDLVSDYDSQRQFRVAVDRNAVSVLTTHTADGKLWTGQVITTSQLVGEVCLQRVTSGGGRVEATQARNQTNYVFTVWDVESRQKLTPRLHVDVWFAEDVMSEKGIRHHWTDPQSGEITLCAVPPAFISFDVSQSDYGPDQTFRISTEVVGQMVVVWQFVDANPKAAQRYRMQLGIYPTAPNRQEQPYNIIIDQFRAGL